MLGSDAERKATMRRGVRALIASAEAEVPKVEFNVRKSYGVAADAQQHRASPAAEPAIRLAGGGVGRHPDRGRRGRRLPAGDRGAPDPDAHREMIEERLLRLRSPFKAAMSGDVVDLIDPRETRRLACIFVKLAQPALHKLAQRPKRAVRP